MRQLSRLISILTLLKSKRLLTATEVVERFDVSVRTVYRDMRKLEESGVPIATIEGKGDSLVEGYTVALYSISSKWVLMAWCHLRQEYRSFRIDRIQRFEVLNQKFEDRKFDFGNYFTHQP